MWGRRLVSVVALLLCVTDSSGQATQQPNGPTGGFPDQLLQHREVQEELKLTGGQVQRINEMRHAVHEKHREELDKLRDLGPQERHREQAVLDGAISREMMQALSRILEPAQFGRLEQIHRQQQGLRVFSDPGVDKILRLTNKQKQNIKKLSDDAANEARMLFRTAAQNGFQETLKKIETVRQKAIERCVALLTDEQRKAWKDLIGEPFEVKSAPPLIRQPVPPAS
jgi:Spy/CpxP family protein refolding chaperone